VPFTVRFGALQKHPLDEFIHLGGAWWRGRWRGWWTVLGITASAFLVPVPVTTRSATVSRCRVYCERLLLLAPTTLRVTRRPRSKPAVTIHRTRIRRTCRSLPVVVIVRATVTTIPRISRDSVVPVSVTRAARATWRTRRPARPITAAMHWLR